MACSRMPKCMLRPRGAVGLEIARPFEGQPRLGGRGQVGRAADQPGNVLRERVEHLARRIARGQALGIRRKRGHVRVPAFGQLAVLHAVELIGQLGVLGPVVELAEPGVAQLLAAIADAAWKCS